MSGLILLVAPDCHLCAHARDVLGGLELAWREVGDDGPEGRRLAALAPPLRPVLFAPDERVVAYGRLSSRRLARRLMRGDPAA